MGWKYSLSLRDNFNGIASRSFDIVAADYAAARVVADAILAASGNLSDAAISEERLTEVLPVASVAGPTSNVDVGITWSFDLGAGKTAAINFPSPVLTVVNPDRSVDLTDPLVVALMTLYENGSILVSDGEAVAGVIGGKLDR